MNHGPLQESSNQGTLNFLVGTFFLVVLTHYIELQDEPAGSKSQLDILCGSDFCANSAQPRIEIVDDNLPQPNNDQIESGLGYCAPLQATENSNDTATRQAARLSSNSTSCKIYQALDADTASEESEDLYYDIERKTIEEIPPTDLEDECDQRLTYLEERLTELEATREESRDAFFSVWNSEIAPFMSFSEYQNHRLMAAIEGRKSARRLARRIPRLFPLSSYPELQRAHQELTVRLGALKDETWGQIRNQQGFLSYP